MDDVQTHGDELHVDAATQRRNNATTSTAAAVRRRSRDAQSSNGWSLPCLL